MYIGSLLDKFKRSIVEISRNAFCRDEIPINQTIALQAARLTITVD
jgi:hypothetical protein